MRHAIFLLAAAIATGIAGGCCSHRCGTGCNAGCGPSETAVQGAPEDPGAQYGPGGPMQGAVPYGGPSGDPGMYGGGPPTAAVTYPYYTTRGPRDFFAKNPDSIGP